MKFRFLSLYFVATFIFFGIISTEKVLASSPSSILVDVIPSNPAPLQDTTITLSSYADNLNVTMIKWFVGGKELLSGIGKKSFSLKAPVAGSETIVTAVVSLSDGDIKTNITVRPATVVLLWQADDSYTPPFYKGKALASPDSEIKIVAMPEVRTSSGFVDPKNMNYDWTKDFTNMPENSGYGKNSLTYVSDYLDPSNNIGVVASTVDQKYSSSSNIEISTTKPEIVFYKYDNNLGILSNTALTNPYNIKGPETIQAVPYYVSPEQLQSPRLIWNWSINNSLINAPTLMRRDLLPIEPESGTTGTSVLKLEIENMDKVFETVSKEINIQF